MIKVVLPSYSDLTRMQDYEADDSGDHSENKPTIRNLIANLVVKAIDNPEEVLFYMHQLLVFKICN